MREPDDRHRALAKLAAFEHPLRLAILTRLTLEAASAKELAEELETPLGKVRYQLDRLRKAGFARVEDERQRRGVSEQVYVGGMEPLTEAELSALATAEREKAVADSLRALVNDGAKALRAGVLGKRDGVMLARLPLPLDEEGWADALAIHRDAQAELVKVGDQSRRRLQRRGSRGVRALAFLFLFEAGPPDPNLIKPD